VARMGSAGEKKDTELERSDSREIHITFPLAQMQSIWRLDSVLGRGRLRWENVIRVDS